MYVSYLLVSTMASYLSRVKVACPKPCAVLLLLVTVIGCQGHFAPLLPSVINASDDLSLY